MADLPSDSERHDRIVQTGPITESEASCSREIGEQESVQFHRKSAERGNC